MNSVAQYATSPRCALRRSRVRIGVRNKIPKVAT